MNSKSLTCFIISPVWAQRALIFASTLGFIWCWTAGSESLSDSISELDWSRSSDIIKAPMNCADFTIINFVLFVVMKNGSCTKMVNVEIGRSQSGRYLFQNQLNKNTAWKWPIQNCFISITKIKTRHRPLWKVTLKWLASWNAIVSLQKSLLFMTYSFYHHRSYYKWGNKCVIKKSQNLKKQKNSPHIKLLFVWSLEETGPEAIFVASPWWITCSI